MACGKCGGRAVPPFAGSIIGSSKLVKDANGMISLSSFDGCAEPYSGQFQGASVLVAGRGTDAEKIFVKGHRTEALRYAHAKKTTLDAVHVTNLCHDAVVSVLGA